MMALRIRARPLLRRTCGVALRLASARDSAKLASSESAWRPFARERREKLWGADGNPFSRVRKLQQVHDLRAARGEQPVEILAVGIGSRDAARKAAR